MLFYNIGVFLYGCFIKTMSPFNAKAKKWVIGRRDIFTHIANTLQEKNISGYVVWFHCASLGEFEQGRPVIEALKKSNTNTKTVLTFFSPSGYEIQKDYGVVDAVFYLPLDTRANVKQFISLVKPNKAVFVKYEFWLNYLRELKQQNISTYLISAVFRPEQHFFKWYGKAFFNSLKTYKKIFVQDEASYNLLKKHHLQNIEIAGDTRFDRVAEISETKKELSIIDIFCANSKVLVAGSTWPKDEEIVMAAYSKLKAKYPDLKLIIAPHEVNKTSVARIEKLIAHNYTLYTNPTNIENSAILIVDTIGILSQLYRYGAAAYIGGGFNDGIHNILEALIYNIPAAFGTNHQKFVEAQETLQLNFSKEITNENDLFVFLDEILSSTEKQEKFRNQIQQYMQGKLGATKKIIAELAS